MPLSAILQFKGQTSIKTTGHPSINAASVTTSTTSADDTLTAVVVAADVAVASVPTRAEAANRVKEWFQTLLVLSENDYRLFLTVYELSPLFFVFIAIIVFLSWFQHHSVTLAIFTIFAKSHVSCIGISGVPRRSPPLHNWKPWYTNTWRRSMW